MAGFHFRSGWIFVAALVGFLLAKHSGIAILIVLSTLLITLPENLLKSENTPYVFDNAGWYEQWTDGTGEIT